MIDPSELRPGNFVFCNNELIALNKRILGRKGKVNSLNPVELTEQWLLKIVEISGNKDFYELRDRGNGNIFYLQKHPCGRGWAIRVYGFTLTCTEYVHELQNWYFFTCGKKELTFINKQDS